MPLGWKGLVVVFTGLALASLSALAFFSGKVNQSQKQDVNKSEFEGLFRIRQNGKTGFIDRTGKVVIPPQSDLNIPDYGEYPEFKAGLAQIEIQTDGPKSNVLSNSKFGFVDTNGTVVVPPQYDSVYDFSEGLALVQMNHRYGFIDTTGRVVIPLQWQRAGYFYDGLAHVCIDINCGYIDKTGQVVIPMQFNLANDFSEGLALAGIKDKLGYIDRSGRMVIEWREGQSDAGRFSEGLASIKIGEKHGFIDKTGQIVNKPEYDSVTSFSDGMALVVVAIDLDISITQVIW